MLKVGDSKLFGLNQVGDARLVGMHIVIKAIPPGRYPEARKHGRRSTKPRETSPALVSL